MKVRLVVVVRLSLSLSEIQGGPQEIPAKQSIEKTNTGKEEADLNRVREAQGKNPRAREQKMGTGGGSELMKGRKKNPIPIRPVCSPLSPLMRE